MLPYEVRAGRGRKKGRSWTFTFSCSTWSLEESQGKAKGRSQAGTGGNVWPCVCVCVYTHLEAGAKCWCLEGESTRDGSLRVSECVLSSCMCGGCSGDGRRRKQPEVQHDMASFPPTSPCPSGFQGHLYSSKARPSSSIIKRVWPRKGKLLGPQKLTPQPQ